MTVRCYQIPAFSLLCECAHRRRSDRSSKDHRSMHTFILWRCIWGSSSAASLRCKTHPYTTASSFSNGPRMIYSVHEHIYQIYALLQLHHSPFSVCTGCKNFCATGVQPWKTKCSWSNICDMCPECFGEVLNECMPYSVNKGLCRAQSSRCKYAPKTTASSFIATGLEWSIQLHTRTNLCIFAISSNTCWIFCHS